MVAEITFESSWDKKMDEYMTPQKNKNNNRYIYVCHRVPMF